MIPNRDSLDVRRLSITKLPGEDGRRLATSSRRRGAGNSQIDRLSRLIRECAAEGGREITQTRAVAP